jgi:hypothetical protein
MTNDRKYFTNHGLHQYKLGKELLAKEIACQIREIVNSGKKMNLHIPFTGKMNIFLWTL